MFGVRIPHRFPSLRDPESGFTLIELMVVTAIVGIMSAIAIPNFTRFVSRSRQAEVQANLKAAFSAEHAYYQEVDSFTNLITLVGFSPERGNRYSYDFGGGVYQSRSTTVLGADTHPPTQTSVEADTFQFSSDTGTLPVMPYAFPAQYIPGAFGSFSVTASGHIEHDGRYDQWSISSLTRVSGTSSTAVTTCAKDNNPGGEPCMDFDETSH